MNRISIIVASLALCSWPAFSATAGTEPAASAKSIQCGPVGDAIADAVREGRLKELFSRFGIDPEKHRVYFVAVDHRQPQDMLAFRREPGVPETTALTKVTVVRVGDGLPEVLVGRNDRVVFVLANTTPPLYALAKETTTAPIPSLEDLTRIVNVAGQWLSSVAQRPTGTREFLVATPDVSSLGELIDAFKPVTNRMVLLEGEKQSMILRLQYGEYGKSSDSTMERLTEGTADVDAVFATLRKARQNFTTTLWAKTYGCQEAIDLATRVTTALANPASAGSEINRVSRALDNSMCPEEATRELRNIIKKIPDSLKEARDDLDAFIENGTATMAALKAAGQLINAELPTAKTAAILQRLSAAPGADKPCTYTAGLVFADSPNQVTFDRIGTVKVTISEVNPFGATFDRRPDATGVRSFRIANPTARRIAVSVGGIYTPLTEPTYKAVTNPLNANEKVITRTGERQRSGAVALLGAYRWRDEEALLRPGLQFGVGFGSAPQIFGGFSLDVSPVIRIGLGATGQLVEDLASGQKALAYDDKGNPLPGATVVASDSEIRLKQRHQIAPYLSLSISLDSLSLFKRP